ncbi:MAG: flagellar export chaperone FliS [Betaproteobacteria bacterium]|nr:flagellar export chaperone FliS [Betaproteobacteria bacterium]
MFAPYRSNAVAYRQLGVETAIADATPHKLIAMLFDGAHEFLRKAASAMERKDYAAKGEAITRVIRIIDEGLRASLDDRGGELTGNLRTLYTYLMGRLLTASLRNDPEILTEVGELLDTVSSAWAQIAPGRGGSTAAAAQGPASSAAPARPALRSLMQAR